MNFPPQMELDISRALTKLFLVEFPKSYKQFREEIKENGIATRISNSQQLGILLNVAKVNPEIIIDKMVSECEKRYLVQNEMDQLKNQISQLEDEIFNNMVGQNDNDVDQNIIQLQNECEINQNQQSENNPECKKSLRKSRNQFSSVRMYELQQMSAAVVKKEK